VRGGVFVAGEEKSNKMMPARIVIKHRGQIVMDMPVIALLHRMRLNGHLMLNVDDSTLIETHNVFGVQVEDARIPDDDY
jgi:hypothetical protein